MKKIVRMVKAPAESVFIEKKSKFISYIAPVLTEQEAVEFINSIKKKHYDATHNCSAFIIGEQANVQRSSDDGEPSGTAGIPMLEVLRKEGLTNTAVVVTRYFGGIMLGAGGLIRAYTQGAADAVRTAGTMRLQPYAVYKASADYGMLSKLQHEIAKKNYILADIEYTENVTLKLLCEPETAEMMQQDLIQWTNANIHIEYLGIEILKMDEQTEKIL